MLINVTSPNAPKCECMVNNLFLLHRHVQNENPIRNYYSNQNVAPRHIQKLIASVEKAHESCSRKRNNTLSHKPLFASIKQVGISEIYCTQTLIRTRVV